MKSLLPKLVLLVFVVAFPPAAGASETLPDLNVTNLSLAVNAKGEALLRYTREDGVKRQVLVWGGIDALASSPDVPQVKFAYDFAGGWKKYRRVVASTFGTRCGAYDGPALAFRVAACNAPDGSYWAVQAWYRLLPMRGFDPWTPRQAGLEFHVSHWSGPLAQLQVSQNWTYGGAWQGLFGRLTYAGSPVYGFKTPSRHQSRGRLRASRLHRHAQLRLRPRLAPRRGEGAAPQERRLLLQLRAADAARRAIPTAPRAARGSATSTA